MRREAYVELDDGGGSGQLGYISYMIRSGYADDVKRYIIYKDIDTDIDPYLIEGSCVSLCREPHVEFDGGGGAVSYTFHIFYLDVQVA